MWLINTKTLKLHEYPGTNFPNSDLPKYAILSHVWIEDEVRFHEMLDPTADIVAKAGYKKIQSFCTKAQALGYDYAWADTACIDKRSSAELSEAINSMFRWYQEADVCVVYLGDVSSVASVSRSRWFTRGWTLQEMLANSRVQVYASDWQQLDFREVNGFQIRCSAVTGVPVAALTHEKKLFEYCIANRMSWAADRKTTRPEDRAYSLMGIFNVNMPILYGEGSSKAFRRLQEEILKNSSDMSLFAWRGHYEESGLLARDPDAFRGLPDMQTDPADYQGSCSQTNVGLVLRQVEWIGASFDKLKTAIRMQRAKSDPADGQIYELGCVAKTKNGWGLVFLRLRRVEGVRVACEGQILPAYRRIDCHALLVITLAPNDFQTLVGRQARDKVKEWQIDVKVVLEDEQHALMERSRFSEARRYLWGDLSSSSQVEGWEYLTIPED